jgi:hypothetical protein
VHRFFVEPFIKHAIVWYRIVSYHRPELTTPRMCDARAIAEWHKSSNWRLNHYLHGDNKHAWKIENGEMHGPGTEDRENECDVVVDPRLCEPIDFGAHF